VVERHVEQRLRADEQRGDRVQGSQPLPQRPLGVLRDAVAELRGLYVTRFFLQQRLDRAERRDRIPPLERSGRGAADRVGGLTGSSAACSEACSADAVQRGS